MALDPEKELGKLQKMFVDLQKAYAKKQDISSHLRGMGSGIDAVEKGFQASLVGGASGSLTGGPIAGKAQGSAMADLAKLAERMEKDLAQMNRLIKQAGG